MYLGYEKNDLRYRTNVVEPICELVRFMGREIDKRNPRPGLNAQPARAPPNY